LRQLAEHNVQLSAPLLPHFVGDQSAFRLKVPQGTPPLWSGTWNELEGMFLTVGMD
jgi:hypothetical protein